MTKYQIHKSLTHAVLSRETEADDVSLYMALLHTHDIYLKAGVVLDDVVVNDASKPLLLPAITRRHAAEVVSALWSPDDEKGQAEHWYWLFCKRTPYEVLSEVPSAGLARMMELKALLLSDPRVEAVVESD
jgi:hypothetical protein